MPIYEYACTRCHNPFEELVLRKSDEAEVHCPRCQSRKVERLLSRPAATRVGGGSSAPAPNCGPVG